MLGSIADFVHTAPAKPISREVLAFAQQERAKVIERLRHDLGELEFVDSIIACSKQCNRGAMRMPDLLGMLSIALECVPQGAKSPYPELTAVWMLCEDFKMDVTPSLIIKTVEENGLLDRRIVREKFYKFYIGRKASEKYPNWVNSGDVSDGIFSRMCDVASRIMLG